MTQSFDTSYRLRNKENATNWAEKALQKQSRERIFFNEGYRQGFTMRRRIKFWRKRKRRYLGIGIYLHIRSFYGTKMNENQETLLGSIRVENLNRIVNLINDITVFLFQILRVRVSLVFDWIVVHQIQRRMISIIMKPDVFSFQTGLILISHLGC